MGSVFIDRPESTKCNNFQKGIDAYISFENIKDKHLEEVLKHTLQSLSKTITISNQDDALSASFLLSAEASGTDSSQMWDA